MRVSDEIAAEARRIADSYLSVQRAVPVEQIEAAHDAAVVAERDPMWFRERARARWASRMDPYLDALMDTAIRGGRHSDVARQLVSKIMGLVNDSNVTNVILAQLGVDEVEARRVLDRWTAANAMDPHQLAHASAVYLRQYLEANPGRRGFILGALGMAQQDAQEPTGSPNGA